MKNWIARRLAAWLAPHIWETVSFEVKSDLHETIALTPVNQIEELRQCAQIAVENGVIARHAVEELANALGYEVVFSGADSVQILPLNKN